MQRMPRRVDEFQGAAADLDPLSICDGRHPLRRHAAHLAVLRGESRRAVHRLGGCGQDRRIDDVRDPPGMHQYPRMRQRRGQPADPARVVEMNVRQHDEVDRIGVEALSGERRQQVRHRKIRAGIDERGPARIDDQVAGVRPRPDEFGIDDDDALRDALV